MRKSDRTTTSKSLRAKVVASGMTVAMLGTAYGFLASPASAIPDDGNRGQEGSVGASSDCNCGEPDAHNRSDNDGDRREKPTRTNEQNIIEHARRLSFTPRQEAIVDVYMEWAPFPSTEVNRATMELNFAANSDYIPQEVLDIFNPSPGQETIPAQPGTPEWDWEMIQVLDILSRQG